MRRRLSPTMGLALSLVYPELSSFTSGTRGWSREYEEDGVALEEMCLLEDELLMLCWLLWEDTELGRPCRETKDGERALSALPATAPVKTLNAFPLHGVWRPET